MYAFWKPLASVILEGRLYEISDFFAKEATGTMRPVSSNICIYFHDDTIVVPVAEGVVNIPMHKFEFVDFKHIQNYATNYEDYHPPSMLIGTVLIS